MSSKVSKMDRSGKVAVIGESILMTSLIAAVGYMFVEVGDIKQDMTLVLGDHDTLVSAETRLQVLEADTISINDKIDGIICMLQYPSNDTKSRLECLQNELYKNRIDSQ